MLSHVFGSKRVQSVVVNIETGKRIRRILGEIEASYSCIVF